MYRSFFQVGRRKKLLIWINLLHIFQFRAKIGRGRGVVCANPSVELIFIEKFPTKQRPNLK